MVLQYISDNQGHTKAIQLQIPIEQWNRLKERYPELATETEGSVDEIPEWQIELGRSEMSLLLNGKAGIEDWNTAREGFRY